MGMVFGKIDVETPKYEVIERNSSEDYEIREYNPCVVAQVTYGVSQFGGNRDEGFMVLANYIGVLGQPHNTKPEKIAMTAPVITTRTPPPPVVTMSNQRSNDNDDDKDRKKKMMMMVTMQFVLPSKYTKAEDAPMPVDERVIISEVGERKYAVVKFSGVATDTVVEEKVEKLKKSLEKDGGQFNYTVTGEFLLARYNPPWTLPIFRTNEIMIPIDFSE